MRKLVALVIASTAIVVVVYLVRTPNATDAAATIDAAREPGQQQSKAPAHDASMDVTDTGPAPASTAPRPSTARQDSRPATVPLTVEQRQQAACIALAERRLARERAILDAEPKDPSWAYSMEQTVREYMTRRLAASQTEVTGIDCKTTFCEIKAQGFAPEASAEFNEAMKAAPQASWNDFTEVYTSQSEESAKWLLWTTASKAVQRGDPRCAGRRTSGSCLRGAGGRGAATRACCPRCRAQRCELGRTNGAVAPPVLHEATEKASGRTPRHQLQNDVLPGHGERTDGRFLGGAGEGRTGRSSRGRERATHG